ncbi:MAG: hypothetical protein ACR2IK_22770 [Chloroflexota bacterium]
MQSPFSLEVYAQDVIRDRHYAAAQAALIAQLPHVPRPRPDLAARLRLAHALRAAAVRLDPCQAHEPSLVSAPSR